MHRQLLALGNSHLGQAIHTWSLPAIRTCPGRTPACSAACYATKGFYHTPSVRRKLAWNLRQSRRSDFAARMTHEIKSRGALVVRVHAAGDFYSAEYAHAWRVVVRACPATTFYWYTRSWTEPEILAELSVMAEWDNVRGWFSTDRDSEPVPVVPGISVAFLQTRQGDTATPAADLAFRTPELRGTSRIGLPVVCPKNETRGKPEVNCGTCQKCWS
jgi:hypothetical protein